MQHNINITTSSLESREPVAPIAVTLINPDILLSDLTPLTQQPLGIVNLALKQRLLYI